MGRGQAVTGSFIMDHTVRKRESNGIDLADKGGARPPCPCCNVPFSGTTAVRRLMQRAGGQVEHRTGSLGHKGVSSKLRGCCRALLHCSTPASCSTESPEVTTWESPYFAVTKPTKLPTLWSLFPLHLFYQKSCLHGEGRSPSHLFRTLYSQV